MSIVLHKRSGVMSIVLRTRSGVMSVVLRTRSGAMSVVLRTRSGVMSIVPVVIAIAPDIYSRSCALWWLAWVHVCEGEHMMGRQSLLLNYMHIYTNKKPFRL